MFSPDGMFGFQFPVFESGFTPWETEQLTSIFLELENTINSDSGRTVDHDDRKRKRLISNRESARRSRMRKQRHLEDLRNQVNRFRTDNRVIANQLSLVSHHCHLMRKENDRLRSESVALRKRLSDIRQFLIYRQLQQLASPLPSYTVTSVNEQTPLINYVT